MGRIAFVVLAIAFAAPGLLGAASHAFSWFVGNQYSHSGYWPPHRYGHYRRYGGYRRSYHGGEKCGVERWNYKTLADQQAASLPSFVTPTTIDALVNMPAPSNPDLLRHRDGPMETTKWGIIGLLDGYKLEKDEDYHLDVEDPRTHEHIVVEIPSPNCVSDSLKAEMAGERAFVNGLGHQQAILDEWVWLDRYGSAPMVRIEGYGFFDRIHGQRDEARNGAEIHPATRISLEN